MSAKLEQHGVYLLPNALDEGEYAVLEAVREQDRWYLVECHTAPFGCDLFRQRTVLPSEQQMRFVLADDGVLLQHSPTGTRAGFPWVLRRGLIAHAESSLSIERWMRVPI